MSKIHKFAARLSRKIVLGTSLIFVVSLFVLAFFSIDISQKASVKYATELLHTATSEIETPIRMAERLAGGISRTLEEQRYSNIKFDKENFFNLLESGISGNPNMIGLGVFYEPNAYDPACTRARIYLTRDKSSNQIIRKWADDKKGEYPELDYTKEDWYRKPKEVGKSMWFPPYFDVTASGDSTLMITYSFPLKGEDGKVFGVCVADLSLDWIKDKLESLKPYPNSNIIIVDKDFNYICNPIAANPNGGTMYDTPFVPGMSRTLEEGESGWVWERMEETGSVTIESDGKAAFCVFGPMSNGWSIAVNSQYSDAFHDVASLLVLIIFIVLIGLMILYFTTRLTISKEAKPITEFAKAAAKITDGRFDVPIPEVKTQDEVSDLGDALRYMQVSVTDYIEKLEKTTSEKERLASELSVSHDIQVEMLSSDFPKLDKGGIFASCTPAREVGGDLYDFVANDKETFFILGDVSGKGVPAALLMAITIAAFRTLSKHAHTMADMVKLINKTFCHSNKDMMFVTMVVGKIDRGTGEMSFCNAGHNPMLYISQDGKAEFIKAKANLPCGVMDKFIYEGDTFQMAPGSRLLVYSDGLTEAERADKAQYGEDRLLAWSAAASPTLSDEQFVKSLAAEVTTFTEGNEPNDDMTLMSISI